MMYILSPAAVQLRELRRQELLDFEARERLASNAVPRTPPPMPLAVRPGSVPAFMRSQVFARLSLLGRFARVAATTGRPLSRSSPWS